MRELGSCHPDDGFPRGVDLWRVPEHWVAQKHGVHRWSGMGERLSVFRFHDHLRPLADEVLDVHEAVVLSKPNELRLLRLSSLPRSVVVTGALFASWAPGDAFTEQGGNVTVG